MQTFKYTLLALALAISIISCSGGSSSGGGSSESSSNEGSSNGGETPAVSPQQLATGIWDRPVYAINGNWSIERRTDGDFIIFNNNFSTTNGPGLYVFLSTTQLDNLSDNNVINTSFEIKKLISNSGAQEYRIPDNVDLNQYNSLVIFCKPFSALWGAADLGI